MVSGQDVEPANGLDSRDGRWRITRGTTENRTASTVDPEARHMHKTRFHKQDRYFREVDTASSNPIEWAGECAEVA